MQPIQIPKDLPGMPDSYGITVQLTDGTQLTHECVGHGIEGGILTIVTREDTVKLVNFSMVKFIDLDKRWTRTSELRQEYVRSQMTKK